MSFGRLLGQETEYAIRFSPERRHPGNDVIYDVLAQAISARVRTEPGMEAERPQIFTENGGAFHYECFPYCVEGGLIEGATPECRGPAQLLLYQRAQEFLLRESLLEAERTLTASGFPGTLGLLKNCRDAEGHVYGAQESFQARIGTGLALWGYRLGLAALLPALVLTVATEWLLYILLAIGGLVASLVLVASLAFPRARSGQLVHRLFSRGDRSLQNSLAKGLCYVRYVVTWPFISAFSVLLWLFAFRDLRRGATAFLVSRAALSGSGTIDELGRFQLSEKAPSIRRLLRFSIHPEDRCVFDVGNLMKPVLATENHQWGGVHRLFRADQRLQLGLADSCMLEETEFLKVGATALVIDMVEAGYLRDAPRLKRPIEALRALVEDPSFETRVETDRGEWSALELQRFYLERAQSFTRESATTSLETREVLRLWRELLTLLERGDMDRLVGRLDWVTKRYLLARCGDRRDPALSKTIDLRYHELGEGYAARLERSGVSRRILTEEEVEHAVRRPPRGTPAFTRGRFIRNREPSFARVRVSWESARIGGRIHGTVVRFPTDGDRI